MKEPEVQIQAHLATLADSLHDVPEVQPGLTLIDTDLEFAIDIYMSYCDLVGQMALLGNAELMRIDVSQEYMRTPGRKQGSATSVGANDILRALGSDKDALVVLAEQSYEPEVSSPYYENALDVLRKRMRAGSRLKAEGGEPSDDNPASHDLIWGHTIITDPEALLHFTICHFFERFFAGALTDRGGKIAELAMRKDFLINALDDVVILNELNNRGDPAIYEMWAKPKPFGLEWITADRMRSYTNQTNG